MKLRPSRRTDERAKVRAGSPVAAGQPRPRMKQAALDVERGLVDTDRGVQTNRLSKALKP